MWLAECFDVLDRSDGERLISNAGAYNSAGTDARY
jgi:hypothetical protein